MQLSDDRTAVLTDGLHAYGLGECVSAPDVVEVFVFDHAEWELRVGGNALLRVAYGHARLPKPLFDWDKFAVTAERTVGPVDLCRIREIIEAAQDSGHGMMLVVSRNVAEEVDRLGGEAVPINPDDLELDDIVRFGRVDGAVVLGTDGRCYAFGVILDGEATGRGGRGAWVPVQLGRPLPDHDGSRIGDRCHLGRQDSGLDSITELANSETTLPPDSFS